MIVSIIHMEVSDLAIHILWNVFSQTTTVGLERNGPTSEIPVTVGLQLNTCYYINIHRFIYMHAHACVHAS